MPVSRLLGGPLDMIARSQDREPGYRVLLFDLYADDLSDIITGSYQQRPLDITEWTQTISIQQQHDTSGNSANFTFAAPDLDPDLFTFSWVIVYYGDMRVDPEEWPIVFSGLFRGTPSRNETRGTMYSYSHSAVDRSVFFRNTKITSQRAWLPQDADTNLGQICRQIATNTEWGMGLSNQEVLFHKFFDQLGNPYLINKKLQVVDIPAMEALSNIMQVAGLVPGFNAEGKLVARNVDLDKPPVRILPDEALILSRDVPSNSSSVTSSVTVRALDYRMTRLDYPAQKLFEYDKIAIGPFSPYINLTSDYSDNRKYRAVPNTVAQEVEFEGELLADLFSLDPGLSIVISAKDEFSANVSITVNGAILAIVIVTVLLGVYISLKIAAGELGSKSPLESAAAWALDLAATVVMFVILQTMNAFGYLSFEVHGTPYEMVYKELEAKARLADVTLQEESEEEIVNHIIGDLVDAENLAFETLRRRVAESAGRTIKLPPDWILEPNDVIELPEKDETARYYILSISHSLERGRAPEFSITGFRCR